MTAPWWMDPADAEAWEAHEQLRRLRSKNQRDRYTALERIAARSGGAADDRLSEIDRGLQAAQQAKAAGRLAEADGHAEAVSRLLLELICGPEPGKAGRQ